MSFLDKIKSIVNVDEDGYYPDDDIDTGAFIGSDSFDEPEEKVAKPQRRVVRNADDSKVVNIHTTAQLQVVLSKPEKFEEVRGIADNLNIYRLVYMMKLLYNFIILSINSSLYF